MKYIRTKDGIYEVNNDENDDFIVKNKGSNTWCLYSIFKEKYDRIIPADTIEELCDGVIEKCLSGNRFCPIEIFNKQEAIKCMNIDFNKGYKEFYYGIFVEHENKIDFISVAKMNNKGEFELI